VYKLVLHTALKPSLLGIVQK